MKVCRPLCFTWLAFLWSGNTQSIVAQAYAASVMTVEISDDNPTKIHHRSEMETEENSESLLSDSNGVQKLLAEDRRNLHSSNTSDVKDSSEAIETSETLTTTSQKSGFMITDILSGAAARSSAAATLAAVAVSSNSPSPTGIKSSRSHTSIMAAAAAAAVAENDFRARISAAAAALSAAARFNPQSLPILSENTSRTEILLNSSVGSPQLFMHPHAAAAAAAAAAAVSSGSNIAPMAQPSNDLSGDDLSDHDSVSGKGEPSGCFDIGKCELI